MSLKSEITTEDKPKAEDRFDVKSKSGQNKYELQEQRTPAMGALILIFVALAILIL